MKLVTLATCSTSQALKLAVALGVERAGCSGDCYILLHCHRTQRQDNADCWLGDNMVDITKELQGASAQPAAI